MTRSSPEFSEFDLMGGKPAFPNGVNADLFRLRLAYGRIDWANNSLEVGQDWAVFAPLNPTSLASYAIPGFATSGNLWNRMPQIRYEHREGEKSKLIFTAAILDPNAGDNSGNPAFRVIGLGERGSLPAFETRLGFTTPSHGKESSAGVSGLFTLARSYRRSRRCKFAQSDRFLWRKRRCKCLALIRLPYHR